MPTGALWSEPKYFYVPAEKNLDKQIDHLRTRAKKDGITMIIEQITQRRDGSPRRVPIVEITPTGDIREIDAPALRVPLIDHTALAHLDYLDGRMNKRAAEGHARLNELGRITHDYIVAAREAYSSTRKRRRSA